VKRPACHIAISETQALEVLSVFPNPVDDVFTIVAHGQSENKLNLIITDTAGRSVYEKEISLRPGMNLYTVPSENLKAGLYFVHLQSEGISAVSKIIKQ
jgi:hypothetical protein